MQACLKLRYYQYQRAKDVGTCTVSCQEVLVLTAGKLVMMHAVQVMLTSIFQQYRGGCSWQHAACGTWPSTALHHLYGKGASSMR